MLHSLLAMEDGIHDYDRRKFDINNIDDGIRDAVLYFKQAGFNTFTSCEGGEGHCFKLPTVGIWITKGSVLAKLYVHLKHCGFHNVSVRMRFRKNKLDFVYLEGEELLLKERFSHVRD